jgi:hypothetical protein
MRWISHVPAAPNKQTELVLLCLACNIAIAMVAWFLVGSFF